MAEEVQSGQAPVEAIETQMLRQPVVIFILSGVQTLDVLDVGRGCELQLLRERDEALCHVGEFEGFMVRWVGGKLGWIRLHSRNQHCGNGSRKSELRFND